MSSNARIRESIELPLGILNGATWERGTCFIPELGEILPKQAKLKLWRPATQKSERHKASVIFHENLNQLNVTEIYDALKEKEKRFCKVILLSENNASLEVHVSLIQEHWNEKKEREVLDRFYSFSRDTHNKHLTARAMNQCQLSAYQKEIYLKVIKMTAMSPFNHKKYAKVGSRVVEILNGIECSFQGSCFAFARLKGAKFSQADLRGVNFSNARLAEAYFSEANLKGSNFSGADLSNAKFNQADLKDVNFSNAKLAEADLSNAKFNQADLRGVNFSNAKLAEADFSEANLRGANFFGADLSNTKFNQADLKDVNFSNAKLAGTIFFSADLSHAKFSKADLRGLNFFGAKLTGVNFSEANLRDSIFFDADFPDATFSRADLRGVNFSMAKLARANFTNANLTNANFFGADLFNANFSEANIKDASFLKAGIEGVVGLDLSMWKEEFKGCLSQTSDNSLKNSALQYKISDHSKNGGAGLIEKEGTALPIALCREANENGFECPNTRESSKGKEPEIPEIPENDEVMNLFHSAEDITEMELSAVEEEFSESPISPVDREESEMRTEFIHEELVDDPAGEETERDLTEPHTEIFEEETSDDNDSNYMETDEQVPTEISDGEEESPYTEGDVTRRDSPSFSIGFISQKTERSGSVSSSGSLASSDRDLLEPLETERRKSKRDSLRKWILRKFACARDIE